MPAARRVTFYHSPHTRSTGTLALLRELGADYELRVLKMKAGEQRQPAYLAINPMGKVPALVHGETLITEQPAVFIYMGDLYPETGLAPQMGDPLRGAYLRWLAFYGSSYEPALIDKALKRDAPPVGMCPYGDYDTMLATLVAQLAKEMGILVVAVVTKPFRFEMQKRERAAQAGVDELQKHVDSLIVVPNEKLIQVLGRNVSLPAAFAASNDVLHGAVAGISEIINKRGLVNRDFADVRTIMSELGMAMMGTATASGEERGKAAAMAAIKSPLLEDVDLQGARGVLLNITTSSNVELGELYDVTDTVAEFVSADATVLWGHVIDDEMGDEMRVTMVATGLGAKRKMQAVQGGAAAAPRLEIPTLRTGTDNLGVATEAAPVTAGIEVSYDEPTFVRNPGRNTARSLEIPTFLRKQAD